MEEKTVTVEGVCYPLRIHVESRRNTRASIGRRGISLRLPRSADLAERRRLVDKFTQWAIETISRDPGRFETPVPKVYETGDRLDVRGESYLIRIVREKRKTGASRLKGRVIKIHVPFHLDSVERSRILPRLVAHALSQHYLPELRRGVEELNRRCFRFELRGISFRNTTSSWGSCGPDGHLRLSSRLLLAPEDVLDYVCVHELAHLAERGHTERFWKLVAGCLPDHLRRQKWLKDHQAGCRF